MVLYKRKPITPPAPPQEFPPDQEVWVIQATGEVFGTYEEYCSRYDYYSRKKFTCELTGHRNMTFFDAVLSETKGAAVVESKFPEILREPVLRRAHLSTISRMDELINDVYDAFKDDFFPGEHVTCTRADNEERVAGVIRDKIVFSEAKSADGNVLNKKNVRYFLTVDDDPESMAVMDNDHMTRTRRNFSKQMVRTYLRNSLTHDRWDGAPWLVKADLAKKYNIDTTIPPHLSFEYRTAERKAQAALRKQKLDDASLEFFIDNGQFEAVLPALKNRGSKLPRHLLPKIEPQLQNLSISANVEDYPSLKGLAKSKRIEQAPVVIKYPIEDLELPMQRDGSARPPLKFISSDEGTSVDVEYGEEKPILHHASVGAALEVWNTLNAYCEFFDIDAFVFDDFMEALGLPALVECELIAEMHCAMLRKLVRPSGEIEVDLPLTPASSTRTSREGTPAEDEGGNQDEEEAEEEQPDMVTRSRKNKLAAASATHKDKVNGNATERIATHRADEMQGEYDWTERVMHRDFSQGGWQTAMVGLLHQMSGNAREKEICDPILAHLAPLDQYASPETARRQYGTLDVNLRIAALEILTLLAVQTKDFKDYITECDAEMTRERRLRADAVREKKALMEELAQLETERKIQVPETAAEEAVGEEEAQESAELDGDGDVTMNGVDSEEEPHRGPRRSRGGRAKNGVKRKREEKKKAKETEASKQAKKYQKILDSIEEKKGDIRDIEERIAVHDIGLRENNRYRTKPLGRDRFWNRYFWFERNAMPLAGDESSSTADYGYANACIWVQGPDEVERNGFLDYIDSATGAVDKAELKAHKTRIGYTPRERQDVEEGNNRVVDSHHWGYYDDPSSVDLLIAYLDERGEREKELRKELQSWRDSITGQMEVRREHLAAIEIKKAASEEPVVGIATRKKTHVDLSQTKYPCLVWKNSAARAKYGHLLSDTPPARKSNKAAARNREPAVPVVLGKRETRRGTRF